MRLNQTFVRARRALPNLFLALLLAALLLGLAGERLYGGGATNARAGEPPQVVPPRPWTAVASTGAVDEDSLADFRFGMGVSATPSAFGFKANTQAQRLQARYNVTNTFDNNANPNIPSWTTLELGAEAPGNSTVTAYLYRIDRCSSHETLLCSVAITNQPAVGCRTCTFANGSVDFGGFLYVVDIRITRPNVQSQPFAHTLRIY